MFRAYRSNFPTQNKSLAVVQNRVQSATPAALVRVWSSMSSISFAFSNLILRCIMLNLPCKPWARWLDLRSWVYSFWALLQEPTDPLTVNNRVCFYWNGPCLVFSNMILCCVSRSLDTSISLLACHFINTPGAFLSQTGWLFYAVCSLLGIWSWVHVFWVDVSFLSVYTWSGTRSSDLSSRSLFVWIICRTRLMFRVLLQQ